MHISNTLQSLGDLKTQHCTSDHWSKCIWEGYVLGSEMRDK